MITKGQNVEFRHGASTVCGVAENDECKTHVNVRVLPPNGIPGWGIVSVKPSDVVSYGWEWSK